MLRTIIMFACGALLLATSAGATAPNLVSYQGDLTSTGGSALTNNISGSFNVAIGENALLNDNTGGGNTGVGEGALAGNTSGVHNTALGDGADVSNGAVTNATAIGANAVVNTDNSMVFGDGNVIRWGFGNNPAFGHALEVGSNLGNGNAAYLTTGGVWVNTSDRNAKEGITLVDGNSLLQKVNQLPVYRWNYKGEDPSHKHVGPMAQDFYAVFGLGDDNKHISTIDPAGVALASIQALTLKVNQQEAKNDATQAENKMLRSELEDLRKQVNQLLAQSKQDGTAKYSQK